MSSCKKRKTLLDTLLDELNLFRGHILTTVEIVVPPPLWEKLRPRLLSILGDNGLDGAIRRIVSEHDEDTSGRQQ